MSRRVLVLLVVFFVLATAAWWFFLIQPRNSRVADLNDQYDAAVAEGDSLRLALAALRDVQDNDVAFLAAIGQMEAGIPQDPELAVFIEEVTELAEITGIALQAMSPSEPTPTVGLEGLYEINISMALEGEYFELLDFLFRLDDMERIVVVQSISVTPGGGDGGVVEELPEEEEGTTTTTTTGATTTTVAGSTTTSSTTTTSTSTTTTIPVLDENPLLVSMTLKIYTRSPLLPEAVPATTPGTTPEGGGDGEGEAAGTDGGSGEAAPPTEGGTP